jgi:hypothetical protein
MAEDKRKDWVMRIMTDEKANEMFQITEELLILNPENHDDILDLITGKLFAMYKDTSRAVFNAEQVKQLILLRNLLGSLNEMKDMPIIGDIIRKLMEK